MPSGKTHQKIHRKYTPLVYWLVIYILVAHPPQGEWLYCLLATPVGWHLGEWISPDLDMPNKMVEAKRRWQNTIIFLPLVWWWELYARIFSRFGGHRSLATHFPILGTITRLVWISVPVGLLYLTLIFLIGEAVMTLEIGTLMAMVTLGIAFGLVLADLEHVLADIGLLR